MEKKQAFDKIISFLSDMKEHPESVSEQDRIMLESLYKNFCKATNTSEHLRWCVEWVVEKWHSMEEKASGIAPYEIVREGQNIVLDGGANEILKLIAGTGGTAYNNANAKIYVGTDTTSENASQTGVIATGSNRAYANMDSGYPIVDGRTATFRASFGEDSANFPWNEASITNGTGVGSVALNRKVSSMGTKNGGTWTLQMILSLTSA